VKFVVLVACLALLPAGFARGEAQPQSQAERPVLEAASPMALEPAPVLVWGRPVAVFRAPYDERTPAERAVSAAARVKALDPSAREDFRFLPVALEGKVAGVLVGTKSEALFGLLPGDLDPASGETLEEAAGRAVEALRAVFEARAEELRWPIILRGLGLSVGATLLYALVLWLVVRLRRVAVGRIEKAIAESHRKFTVAGINLVPVLLGIERASAKLSAFAAGAVATYLWLTFCLHQFFYTRPWGQRLGAFFIELLREFLFGAVGAVPGLFAVLVIFWITRVVSAGVGRFFDSVEHGYLSVPWLAPDSARASRRIVVVALWMFSLTVAYPYIPGSGSEAFKGISVFAGLMLSLGSSGFVNHIMSGLVIAYSGALRKGDYVTVGGVEGTVNEVGALSTKISTPKREWITIPNGVIVGASITNYSRLAAGAGAMVSTGVTIGYDAPWRQVHALLLLAAERTAGIRKEPKAFVLQRALSDFYVEYELRFHIDRPEARVPVLSELHAAIQDAFNEAGVQIMSPNFEAQPESPVLVPRDKWYAPETPPGKGGDG